MIPYGDYPDHTTLKRILIIKLRHHGDVLLTTPLFSCLNNALPATEIDALIYKETLPMLEGHPCVSTIHTYNATWKKLPFLLRIKRELALVRSIRARRYDAVINLTEGDRGAINALISGASVRLGWDPGSEGFFWKKKVFTHIIRRCQKPRHMVEQNLDACRRLGIFPAVAKRCLHIHIPEEAFSSVRKQLNSIKDTDYIVLHLTSRWLFKCWPLEKNIELIKSLQEKKIPLVLSAAPDSMELKLIHSILEKCGSKGIINLAGKLSLKELAALIKGAKGLITIDSVPMHIASALKKPTIALFGPSSEKAWGPWQNSESSVLHADYPCRPCNLDGCGGGKVSDCLTVIPLSAVLSEVDRLFFSDRGHQFFPTSD